ncbi:MAG: aminopeptidase 1 [Planctomycetota bacterium]|nr:aminopeptidase 1 [Planctomycetota bacterium]
MRTVLRVLVLLTLPLLATGGDDPMGAWGTLSPDEQKEALSFAEEYKRFINVSRTELTTVREVLAFARAHGYKDLFATDKASPGDRLFALNRDRAIALIRVGRKGSREGLRIVGAHIDSPRIDLKARPIYSSGGYALFQTIYHGGIKKYQWSSLPLMLLGRVDRKDGTTVYVEVGMDPTDPVFVIPDLAPHVDRDYRSRTAREVIKGEELDPIVGSLPGTDGVEKAILAILAEKYGIERDDFVSGELSLVPALPPRDVGLDRALVGAYGQDDRLSSFCAYRALEAAGPPERSAIAFLVDNEETGSINNTGATSSFLKDAIARLIEIEAGEFGENVLRNALKQTQVISADVTTGINPLFAGVQESTNAAKVGHGVVIKRYGRGQDAHSEFIAVIRGILDKEGIAWQTHTYKVDVGGGGTIARFLSKENMDVIDMGVAILSMHSTFSLSSKADLFLLYRFLTAFYEGEGVGGR